MRIKQTFAGLAFLLALALAPAGARAQNTLYELASSLATASVPIQIISATTTQLVPAPTGNGPGGNARAIYVTAVDVIANGTGNVQFVAGTGVNCATGQTNVTGNYHLIAQTGFFKGNGLGPILFVPAGNALCVTTNTANEIDGSLSYLIK